MNISTTKVFRFDAAHKLPQHDGKCANLHGHTYTVEVSISGPVQLSGSQEGMLVDFEYMSAFWATDLAPVLDHQYLNETLHIVPTAEMLALWLATHWARWCTGRTLTLTRIRVWETPTSYVEVTYP